MRHRNVLGGLLVAASALGVVGCTDASSSVNPSGGTSSALESKDTPTTVDAEELGSPGVPDLSDDQVALPKAFPLSIPRPESGAIEETSVRLAPTDVSTEDWVTYVVPHAQLAAAVASYQERLELAGFVVLGVDDHYGDDGDQVEIRLDHQPTARVVFAQTGAAVSIAVLVSRS